MMSQYERATGQPESRAKRRRLDIEAEDDDSGRTTRTDTRSRSRRPPNHESVLIYVAACGIEALAHTTTLKAV